MHDPRSDAVGIANLHAFSEVYRNLISRIYPVFSHINPTVDDLTINRLRLEEQHPDLKYSPQWDWG